MILKNFLFAVRDGAVVCNRAVLEGFRLYSARTVLDSDLFPRWIVLMLNIRCFLYASGSTRALGHD